MPDDELLAHAAAGDLHQPEVLVAQARRMLRDDRVRGLATEFAGNWLEFRRFEEHNGVDRERFASFTNELRQAMYEEPIRFFVDLVRRDRSVLELLDADHTFVNPILAKHYGIPLNGTGPDEWVRVDDVRRYGRGGLLPMSVFLTANAPGLRTSPVKRGYWVVRRMLGEHDPAAAAGRPRAAQGRGEAGRADAAAAPGPAPRGQGAARAATSGSTRSAWCSRATARSANAATATSAAGRSSARATFPDGSDGRRPRRPAPLSRRAAPGRVRRQPLPQAARLRPRAQPAPLGRRDDRGDARAALRRRLPLRRPGRVDRHQPAVPQQAGPRRPAN